MVFEKVVKMLADYKEIDPAEITSATTLTELKLDSLDVVQIVMDLEEEFGVTLDTDKQAATVDELVKMIEAKL